MTIIIADTTSSLPIELANSLGIPLIPQLVVFGEETFKDDGELPTSEFLKKLKASPVLPKTAAPLHTLYNPYFSDVAKSGETLFVIAPSDKISGTVRSAETARQEFPNADIRIIDTNTVAGCLGTMVLIAHDLVKAGKTPDEVETALKNLIPRARTYFVLDTLEYLQKGGRIGLAKALLGEILRVKPILQIKDGQAAPFDQERTKKKAIARLIDLSCEQMAGVQDPRPVVMHIEAEDEALACRDLLRARLNIPEIPIYLLPAAIVVHAGPGVLAIGFFA